MKKITVWIKSNQLAAFFVIAFTISWGLGFTWEMVIQRGEGLVLPLAFVAGCGPGLAGIIISAVTNTQPSHGSRKTFWFAFLAAWFVSALVYISAVTFIEHFPFSPVMVVVFTIAVVPVAFIFASTHSRNPSVRLYLSSLIRIRGMWSWVLLALVLFPTLFLLSVPVSNLLIDQSFSFDHLPDFSLVVIGLLMLKLIYQFFFFNATGEESGWRGFVLPRLQTRTSPLISAVIIGFFWAPWHFFVWKVEGRAVMTVNFWLEMFIAHILISVVIVWICNRANGSILVAGIAHSSLNTIQAFAPFGKLILPVIAVCALGMVLNDQMWLKLSPEHLAVYQGPSTAAKNPNLVMENMDE